MPVWLDRLNYYRSLANLAQVSEDPTLSNGYTQGNQLIEGDQQLASYELSTHNYGHNPPNPPNPANPPYPTYTPAAQQSNIYYSGQVNVPQTDPIDTWMAGVFHGLPMINPQLTSVGFGMASDASQPSPYYQTIAALNVRAAASGTTPATPTNPIMWPGSGSTVPLTTYHFEAPDARSMFGYIASIGPDPQAWPNAGVPIFLQLGMQSSTVSNVASTSNPAVTGVTLFSLELNGTDLGSGNYQKIDEFNYNYPDSQQPSYTSLGQNILHAQGAVVLLPKQPLAAGTYTASITVNGQTYGWSFNVLPPITLTYNGPAIIVAGQPLPVNAGWTASGGSGGPYTFTLGYTLPMGLSLSADGHLSGVARGAAVDFRGPAFTLTVTDNAGHTSPAGEWVLEVAPAPITVTPSGQLPDAVQGQPYSVQLSASGGVAPYTFSAIDLSGVGLSLTSQGLISGTPPIVPGSLTTSTFTFGFVSDSNGSQVKYNFGITFRPPSQKRSPQPPPTPPALADGSLVKAADQPEVYVMYGGARFWIPSPAVFTAMGFQWNAIQTISDQDMAAIPNVPQDGTLLREQSTPPVYVMQAGAKCHVLSSAGVVAAGGWEKVRVVPDGALTSIPNGNDIP